MRPNHESIRNLFSISSWRVGGSLNSSPIIDKLASRTHFLSAANQICKRKKETNHEKHPPNQPQRLSPPKPRYPHAHSQSSHPRAPQAGTSHPSRSSIPYHAARAPQSHTPDAATPSSWRLGSGARPSDGLRAGVRRSGCRLRRW